MEERTLFGESSPILKTLVSALFFPLLFQEDFIMFVWGANDTFWLMLGKRIFLLLPVFALILACWISIACTLSVIFRQNRRQFMTTMLITWWDLGRSIVLFWGGIIKLALTVVAAATELVKIALLSLWSIIGEVLFLPFRALRSMSQNVFGSPVPWIAVYMTIFWCIVEATIFTYVTTPLVTDVFLNITGEHMHVNFIRIPLFIFLLFVVLGSYAVLANFVESLKQKNIQSILGIGAIETVVLFVEVLFLYREFVDSLVPWFAQYSENFDLGVFGTLAISGFVWFGIRSLSWYLFAAHGTPTILHLIQGKGVVVLRRVEGPKSRLGTVSPEFMERVKSEMGWIQSKAEDLLSSLTLPPLQVIAATLNFCTLLLNGTHLFQLPFKTMRSVTDTEVLLRRAAGGEQPIVEEDHPTTRTREYEDVQS
jgi:hypothetical protein